MQAAPRYLATVCRVVLGAVLIASAFVKVVDPWGTALKIDEYLYIYGLEALQSISMGLSIALCSFEMALGILLLAGSAKRLTSLATVAVIGGFTLLTLLSATIAPIEDCGCFGDAMNLTAWQTFYKNVALLSLSIYLVWQMRNEPLFRAKRSAIVVVVLAFALPISLGWHSLRHLPIIDFLPYTVGVNIYDELNSTTNSAESVKTTLIYRNRQTGNERTFSLEDTEWQDDTQWEWVKTEISEVEKITTSPIFDFSLRQGDYDATEEILTHQGELYMLCVTQYSEIERRCQERLNAFVGSATKTGARIICITPEPLKGAEHLSFGNIEIEAFNIDATTLKSAMRARDGVIELINGTISAKYSCRDIKL